MEVVSVPVLAPEERWNDSAMALGRLSRSKLCGVTCVWSPDAGVYCAPTLVTAAIVSGTLYTLWSELYSLELFVLALLLIIGFVSGFLVVCTDPGVYPRLRVGESDPLQDEEDLVYCRVCCLRRPPRASHCYQCNVCVKEHDHHCGILGGCVGKRSLRWFTLYLVTIGSASGMGLFWVFRSILSGNFVPRETIQGVAAKTMRSAKYTVSDQEGVVKVLVLVTLIVVIMTVTMFVGGLAVFYVYLLLTSTTRRESQRNNVKLFLLVRPKSMWENLKHVVRPVPSALDCPETCSDSPVVV